MVLRRSRAWDEMRLSGFWAWVHRLVMLITFPIRRFWQILLIVAALALIALIVHFYYGIGMEHVSYWYHKLVPVKELTQAKNEVMNNISGKFSKVKATVKETVKETLPLTTAEKAEPVKEKKHFMAWNVPAFKRAKYKPLAGKITSAEDLTKPSPADETGADEEDNSPYITAQTGVFVTSPEAYKKGSDEAPLVKLPLNTKKVKGPKKETFYTGELSDYYEIMNNRNLVYLQKPVPIYGSAEIFGPNSLYIDDTFMFLYGIYTDAEEYDTEAAQEYLEDLTADAGVRCEIVAYTAQTLTATALCFVEGIFINKALVRQGLARNVSLK